MLRQNKHASNGVDPVRSVRRKNLKLKFKMNKKLLPTLYAIAYKIIKSLKTSILSKLLNSNTLYTIILLIYVACF